MLQIFFFKLAVMPTRALFAAGVAEVEAREQVMFVTGFMATKNSYPSLFINIIFPNTKPALSYLSERSIYDLILM